MRYDVVIIGSGLGGLICGSILSKQGLSVLVLERQAQAGGCMQSYQRNGQWLDTGLHYVGGLAEGQPLHGVFQSLGLMQLPWQRLDADGFDRVTIGQQTFCFAEGYDNFAETLTESFPEDRDALRQYVNMLQHVDSQRTGLFDTSAYQYLTTTFHSPLLINVLSGTAMKMELARDTMPLFTFAHSQSSYIQSSWRLKGSGRLLVEQLVSNIRHNGGQVLCGEEVQQLETDNGLISAAITQQDNRYEGRLFVSNIHPQLTIQLIGKTANIKTLYRKRMDRLENTFGLFTATLLLKAKSLPYFNHNKYIYRKANVWTFHEDVGGVGGVMVSCRVPEDDSPYARQVDLLTPMPWKYCLPWADTQVGHRGDSYQRLKTRMANSCIRLAEKVIPGLSSMVEHCYTSTPLTYRDYNNTPQGSAFGIRKDYRQPLLTILSPRTPVSNLLLTGQSLMLHGVEGVTMTARMTCEEALNIINNRK